MADYKTTSILGDEFELPVVTHEALKQQLVKVTKTSSVKKNQSIEKMPLPDRLSYISKKIKEVLGRYEGFIKCIRSDSEFEQYIDRAIECGIMAFDTETNNTLDVMNCKIMGLCCYIPNTRPVYVPLNHCEPGTETLLANQVSEECVKRVFQKLVDSNIKLIYHNGKFDLRVCFNTMGIWLPIWWDTMTASQLLDENDIAKLKFQFSKKVDPTIGTYNIESFFGGVKYAWVDPDIFALYAAIDSYDTYLLQQKQLSVFKRDKLDRLYNLFLNIEVPIIRITAQMENNGIAIDSEFMGKLTVKFTKDMSDSVGRLKSMLEPYRGMIEYYQNLGKLDKPELNFDSSAQLKVILYDIMKLPVAEDGSRSTKKEALEVLDTDFTNELLMYRTYSKLISSFLNPLPNKVDGDGKIRAEFNPLGKEDNNVRTGRFSSTNPNLQQIPSHELSMRMMFMASKGHVIVGGDFSQQEPRVLTHITNEPTLRDTYNNNKDLYATIGSQMFHKSYWECMEHWEDGKPNPEGKKIRGRCKKIVLAVLYGMGAKTLSKELKISVDECKEILQQFFDTFPVVKQFISNNEKLATEQGYVEDYIGRRRHLPDAQLTEIVAKVIHSKDIDCDVFADIAPNTKPIKLTLEDKNATDLWNREYREHYLSRGWRGKTEFKKRAADASVSVTDNGAYISKARTQSTNARIQGSAATLTKKAMINITNDKRLSDLGFRLLIPVHDELLGECPIENAEQVRKLLAEDMIAAGKPECTVNMKVDTYVVKHWYADEVSNSVNEQYSSLIKKDGKSVDDAFAEMCTRFPTLRESTVRAMCDGTFDLLEEVI